MMADNVLILRITNVGALYVAQVWLHLAETLRYRLYSMYSAVTVLFSPRPGKTVKF